MALHLCYYFFQSLILFLGAYEVFAKTLVIDTVSLRFNFIRNTPAVDPSSLLKTPPIQ